MRRDDGDDLVFTDASGVKLDDEIERFDSATGELVEVAPNVKTIFGPR